MPKRIQFRRDIADNWTLHNPRLMPGEIGMETDTQKYKIGDGVLDWEDLPYYLSLQAMEAGLEGLADEVVTGATAAAEAAADAAETSAGLSAASATTAAARAADALESANDAATSAETAATYVSSTDELVAGFVNDDASDTNNAIESMMATTPSIAPTMNTATRNALSPAPGATIFNTTLQRLEVYNGSQWVDSLMRIELAGQEYSTYSGPLNLGGGELRNAVIKTGWAERDNYSGSSVIDFVDGAGGASAGYGSMAMPTENFQTVGNVSELYFSTGDAIFEPNAFGITIVETGIYLWTWNLVIKRNGGAPVTTEVYLRHDSSGTRTGGYGVKSFNPHMPTTDNLFSTYTGSWIFQHSGNRDYHVVLTAATSATNVTSVGYGCGWQLHKLGDL